MATIPLLAESIAFQVYQRLHSLWQLTRQTIYIIICVDVCKSFLETSSECLRTFFPRSRRRGLCHEPADPCDNRFVEHHLLEGARLLGCIIPHECLQTMFTQCLSELWCDSTIPRAVEALPSVHKQGGGFVYSPRSDSDRGEWCATFLDPAQPLPRPPRALVKFQNLW